MPPIIFETNVTVFLQISPGHNRETGQGSCGSFTHMFHNETPSDVAQMHRRAFSSAVASSPSTKKYLIVLLLLHLQANVAHAKSPRYALIIKFQLTLCDPSAAIKWPRAETCFFVDLLGPCLSDLTAFCKQSTCGFMHVHGRHITGGNCAENLTLSIRLRSFSPLAGMMINKS